MALNRDIRNWHRLAIGLGEVGPRILCLGEGLIDVLEARPRCCNCKTNTVSDF
jgi:hypothetical protein